MFGGVSATLAPILAGWVTSIGTAISGITLAGTAFVAAASSIILAGTFVITDGIIKVKDRFDLAEGEIATTSQILASYVGSLTNMVHSAGAWLGLWDKNVDFAKDVSQATHKVFSTIMGAYDWIIEKLKKIPGIGHLIKAQEYVHDKLKGGAQGAFNAVFAESGNDGLNPDKVKSYKAKMRIKDAQESGDTDYLSSKEFAKDQKIIDDYKASKKKEEEIKKKRSEFVMGHQSSKFESNADVGKVSTGKGDHGGVSYGAVQISSKNIRNFIEGSQFRDQFRGMQIGSKEFNKTFEKVAKANPEAFGNEQRSFNKKENVAPLMNMLRSDLDYNASGANPAIQEMMYSIATQHGATGGKRLIDNALGGKNINDLSPEQLIKMIYKERGSRNNDGTAKYFGSSSRENQNNILNNRFPEEEAMTLALLNQYGGGTPTTGESKMNEVAKNKRDLASRSGQDPNFSVNVAPAPVVFRNPQDRGRYIPDYGINFLQRGY